jgi:hypothetical protein
MSFSIQHLVNDKAHIGAGEVPWAAQDATLGQVAQLRTERTRFQ